MAALAAFNNRHLPLPPQYPGDDEDLPPFPKPDDTGDVQHGLRHITTAPAAFPAEAPPGYAAVDELVRSFSLYAPLIYATQTSNTPRYQLLQEFTRSGRPRKLHIRRLLPAESRSHSLPSCSLAPPRIDYDEDGTMYTISSYEMKGLRESTLRGSITLESGTGMRGKWCRIYRLTKNSARDYLDPANEARMQKYGYHASDEWNKSLLFSIRKGRWHNEEGKVVAVEDGREFRVEEMVDGRRRDLLVACWVMRVWMCEGMRWEGDWLGR